MPSLASATLEMRSSLAFCARSMAEAIYESFCCGTGLCLILRARHYKGCAIARTLTEIKIQAARTRSAGGTIRRASVFATVRYDENPGLLQEQSSGLTKGGV